MVGTERTINQRTKRGWSIVRKVQSNNFNQARCPLHSHGGCGTRCRFEVNITGHAFPDITALHVQRPECWCYKLVCHWCIECSTPVMAQDTGSGQWGPPQSQSPVKGHDGSLARHPPHARDVFNTTSHELLSEWFVVRI